MPFIPAPGVVQVELTADMAGERTQNVLHYKIDDGLYSEPEMTALGEAIVAYMAQSFVKGLYPSTWQLIGVRVIDLTADFAPAIDIVTGLPVTGTRAGAQLPNNCALVITKRTIFRGRSYRGRIYFGPLVEADVTNNAVSGAYVTSLVTNLSGLITITDANSEVHRMQVLSRYTNKNPRIEAVATPVLGFTCDGILDSQRRRLPGRGN